MCDSCIDLLDVSAGFKERCLEIFQKTFAEETVSLQEDEMILYETEEYVDEPLDDLELEHAEGDPFQEAVLDEDMAFFVQDIKPEMRCTTPVIHESALPSTSQKKYSSPRLKREQKAASPVCKRSSSEAEQAKVGKSRMSYTSSKKLEVSLIAGPPFTSDDKSNTQFQVVRYAELVGNRQAAKAFFVDESCVRKWRTKKKELLEIDSDRCTKRKPNLHWPDLDKNLREWVNEQLSQGIEVKPSMIKAKSIEIASSLELIDFKGTSSYVFKFMQRYRIPGSKRTKQT